jgi:tripartite-type tricarboxylate transporter receptor subunit TctC
MKLFRTITGLGVVGALGAAAFSAPAAADPIADFYKGKRLSVIVGSSPGGGYDTYARTLVRHMGRFIPGKPSFLVKNLPGAGSIKAANYVANVAPQDGTVIGAIQRSAPLVQILGQKGPRFEAAKLNWLGSMNNEVGVIAVMKRTGVKTLNEAFDKQVILGSTGPNDTEQYPALLNNTLGTKFKMIRGYPSTPPAHLAMERGELDGISQSWSSFKLQAGKNYEEGKFNILVQLSTNKHPELTKLGVPLVFDVIKDRPVMPGFTKPEVETYLRLMLATKAMGTAQDAKFQSDAKKQRREVVPVFGEELQAIVVKMAAAPKKVLADLDGLIKYRGKAGKAKIEMAKHTGKVTATKRGGRRIVIMYKGKNVTAKVSGSRTKITVGGKKAKRKAVKVGMTCTFTYPGAGQEATNVDCKG